MKTTLSIIALMIGLTSCGRLVSQTTIKPNERFVLGDNTHYPFKVKLTNVSPASVEVFRQPITGGQHSLEVVKPNKSVTVRVESNTALVVNNPESTPATVNLIVTGDTGLSMGYKRP